METENQFIHYFLNLGKEEANAEILKFAADSFFYLLVEEGEIQILSSEGVHSEEGLASGKREWILGSHQLGVFVPHTEVQITKLSESLRYHLLIVNENLYGLEIFRLKMYYQYMLYQHPVLSLEERDSSSVVLLLERIQGLLEYKEHFFWQSAIQAAFYSLMLEIGNSCLKNRDSKVNLQTKKDAVFQEFIQLAIPNFRKEHGIEFYADEMCMTAQNLTQVITQITGMSPVGILRNLLFQEARLLLHDSSRTIQQVSDELGFSDQSAFGKFFRSKEGVTPAEFRRQHQI